MVTPPPNIPAPRSIPLASLETTARNLGISTEALRDTSVLRRELVGMDNRRLIAQLPASSQAVLSFFVRGDDLPEESLAELLIQLAEKERSLEIRDSLSMGCASNILSFCVFTPAIATTILGTSQWRTWGEMAAMSGVLGTATAIAHFVIIPLTNRLQSVKERPVYFLRKGLSIVIEATVSVTVHEVMGLFYGWDPLQTLKSGGVMGLVKGYPSSTISERWGDPGQKQRRTAMAMRYGALIVLQTEAAIINATATHARSNVSWKMSAIIVATSIFLERLASKLPQHPFRRLHEWWKRSRFNPWS